MVAGVRPNTIILVDLQVTVVLVVVVLVVEVRMEVTVVKEVRVRRVRVTTVPDRVIIGTPEVVVVPVARVTVETAKVVGMLDLMVVMD